MYFFKLSSTIAPFLVCLLVAPLIIELIDSMNVFLRMIYNDKYSNFDGLLINVNYFSVPHNNIHALTIEMYKVENGVSSETKDKIFKVKCRSPLL